MIVCSATRWLDRLEGVNSASVAIRAKVQQKNTSQIQSLRQAKEGVTQFLTNATKHNFLLVATKTQFLTSGNKNTNFLLGQQKHNFLLVATKTQFLTSGNKNTISY